MNTQMAAKKNSRVLIARLFKSLIAAQIVAQVTPSLANVSNGLLIGNSLTSSAMAALSFVAPMGGLFAALAAVISLGSNILCGNCMGRGEEEEIGKIFTTALVAITTLGVVLTVVAELFTGSVASMLGAEGEALPDTISYLRGLCMGIIPTLVVPCLVVFLNMANEIIYAMISTIVLAVVNLLAGLVNMKFLGGGMFGMGLASAISQYAAMLFLILRFVRKKHLARPSRSGFRMAYVGRIVLLGSPSALMFFLYFIRNIQINSMTYTTGGTDAVAALGFLSSSAGLFDAFNTGIGATIVMLASVMAGEEDRESLKNLLRYTMTFGFAMVIIKTGVYVALAKPISLLFGARGEALKLSIGCIYMYALCMPFNLIPTAIMKNYQCLNRIFLTNVMNVLTCIVFPIAVMKIAGKMYGIYGVWSCYAMAEVFTILVLFLISWVRSGHFPKTTGDWLWLDKTFKTPTESQYSVSICLQEEAGDAIMQVLNFAKCKGISDEKRRAQEAVLKNCIRNIFAQETAKGDLKPKAIDILASVKGEEFFIRLRDNYAQPDQAMSNEQMKGSLVHELKYQQTFGMNILSWKI